MDNFVENFENSNSLINKLMSSKLNGLNDMQVERSKKYFGANKVEPPPPTSFFSLILDAMGDLTMIILTIAAVLSIILGTTV